MTDEKPEEFFDKVQQCCSLLTRRHLDDALKLIEELAIAAPGTPEVVYVMGVAALMLDEYGRSLMLFEEAHNLDPECMEYADALACLHTKVGNLGEGLYYAKLATTMDPHPQVTNLLPPELSNYFEALSTTSLPRNYLYGKIKAEQHKFTEAAKELERHLQLQPDHVDCNLELSAVQTVLGEYADGIKYSLHAVELAPEDPAVQMRAAMTCVAVGAHEAAAYHIDNVVNDADASYELVAAAHALAANSPVNDPVRLQALDAALREMAVNLPALPREAHPSTERKAKIHVAYMSNRLWDPDLAAFLEPILRLHDRDKFEVFLYQQNVGSNLTVQQLKGAAGNIRKLWELDDETASVIVAGDEIDILVDMIVPAPENRASLVAMSPATIQASLHVGGLGANVPGIGNVLCDSALEPTLRDRIGEGQKLRQFPSGLWSLAAPNVMPPVAPLPAQSAGYVTFAASCDLASLTPSAVAAYAKVLEAVPNSRLLFAALRRVDAYPANHIAQTFSGTGVEDRVGVWNEHGIEDRMSPDHSFWREADIFLVAGGLSEPLRACQALWQGLPVLALGEDTPVSRIATSILTSAEKAEWAFESVSEFVAKAVDLAADVDGIADLRQSLRDTVAGTALFMPSVQVAALEALYTTMVEERADAQAVAEA